MSLMGWELTFGWPLWVGSFRPIADIEVFEVTAGQPTYAEIHNHGRNDRLQAYQYSK
jgi:hypothetical protein